MMPVADTKGSITLKNGRGVIPVGTMKEPGFRDCRLKATVDGKVAVTAEMTFAVG